MSNTRARVAIIGANFAGIAAARRLSSRHSVTLLDPSRPSNSCPTSMSWSPASRRRLTFVCHGSR